MHQSNAICRTAWGLALLGLCAAAFGDQDKVLQFKSATKLEQHLVVLAYTPHAKVVRLLVANTDPKGPYDPVADQNQFITGLKAGDLIQASWDTADGVNTLSAVAHYTPKPGELTPNGYLFVSSGPKSEKSADLVVVLNKLGDIIQCAVPALKTETGGMQPDAGITAALGMVHQGDPVWADMAPGATPTLAALLPYSEPQNGKLIKIETIDVFDHKQPAAQINQNNTTIEAEIPGTLKDGKWIADTRIMSELRRCKAGDPVLFRVQLVDADNWLREMQPVPTQPVAARQGGQGGSGDSGSNTDANGIPKGRTIGGGTPGVGGIGIGGF